MLIDATRMALRWRRQRPAALPAENDGIVLGFEQGGQSVHWPQATLERAGHVAILASSGAGKTILVAQALAEELRREPTHAALIVDPKGDLGEAVLQGLAVTCPQRLRDVALLDPFSDGGFPFNLCRLPPGRTPIDIRALQLAGLIGEVSTAVGAQQHLGVGARQLDVLQHVVLAVLDCAHPAASPLWALDALTDPKGLIRLARVTRNDRARAFLLTARLSDELRSSTASRIRTAFAASESLERLMAAPACIHWAELLAPGKICIVDLGRPFGGMAALQTFYANVIVRLAIEHLLDRPSPWRGHHARIVIDECQVVAPVLADAAEAILTTGRSRGTSLTAISQGTVLIHAADSTLLRVLMTNTPTKLIGRLAAPDAELLAREQAPSAGIDESLSSVRARFVSTVTNLPDRCFYRLTPGERRRFRSIDVDLGGWRDAAAVQAEAFAAIRTRLALPADSPRRVLLADVAEPPSRNRRPPRQAPAAPTTPAENPVPEAPLEQPVPPGPPRSRWG